MWLWYRRVQCTMHSLLLDSPWRRVAVVHRPDSLGETMRGTSLGWVLSGRLVPMYVHLQQVERAWATARMRETTMSELDVWTLNLICTIPEKPHRKDFLQDRLRPMEKPPPGGRTDENITVRHSALFCLPWRLVAGRSSVVVFR